MNLYWNKKDWRLFEDITRFVINKSKITKNFNSIFLLIPVVELFGEDASEIHTGINPRTTIIITKKHKRHPTKKKVPNKPKLLKNKKNFK